MIELLKATSGKLYMQATVAGQTRISSRKPTGFVSAAMLICMLVVWKQPAHALESGKPAPEFTLPATHNNPGGGASSNIQLSDYKGKIVYLDFWASWCRPCKQSFPWMNALQSKYGAQGFQVVAVNVDAEKDDALQFLKATPGNFTVAYDPKGKVAQQYEVKGMPTSILIGRDGKVLSQHAGFFEASKQKIEQAIAASVAEKQ